MQRLNKGVIEKRGLNEGKYFKTVSQSIRSCSQKLVSVKTESELLSKRGYRQTDRQRRNEVRSFSRPAEAGIFSVVGGVPLHTDF